MNLCNTNNFPREKKWGSKMERFKIWENPTEKINNPNEGDRPKAIEWRPEDLKTEMGRLEVGGGGSRESDRSRV